MKIDGLVDIVLLVMWLAVGATAIVWSLVTIQDKLTDYNMGDKIGIVSLDDNTPDPVTFDARDLVLMLIISDENQPYPRAIQLNSGTTLQTNASFYASQEVALNNFWNSQIHSVSDKDITNFDIAYDGGVPRWKITTAP